MPGAAIIVLTTMPDREAAEALARTLLAGRLAACVNVGASVESMYHWRGQIETADDIPLAIKSRAELYPKVQAAILASHPYELPEIVAVPISDALPGYLDWIAAETVADAD